MGGRRGGPRGFGPEPAAGGDVDDLTQSDPEEIARAIGLRRLTASPQTRAQLADAMARRGVPDDVADRVLDRFEEVRLIDDAAFAQSWVRSRQAGRGLSRRALRHELAARGVAADVVSGALDEVGADDERRAAEALVRRRLPLLSGVDAATRTRRLLGMLARKGYPEGMAAAVVRDVLREDAAASSASDDALAVEGTLAAHAERGE